MCLRILIVVCMGHVVSGVMLCKGGTLCHASHAYLPRVRYASVLLRMSNLASPMSGHASTLMWPAPPVGAW
ncbi:hypothetical protein SpCBS45565_g07560 [Spizellomyces sp. 'palustris']|nr:hypothetical protein SpCBS45565_g07560 [Spizellomyces sp. 'palustris']